MCAERDPPGFHPTVNMCHMRFYGSTFYTHYYPHFFEDQGLQVVMQEFYYGEWGDEGGWRTLIKAGQDHKSAVLKLVKYEPQLLMQRRAQAYLSTASSLTRCWVQPAYDLCLCNDMEAAEPDKRLRLIKWNVWCEIFNAPLSSCSSLGVYGSVWKVFYLFSTL